jgi:hypothetical protein
MQEPLETDTLIKGLAPQHFYETANLIANSLNS